MLRQPPEGNAARPRATNTVTRTTVAVGYWTGFHDREVDEDVIVATARAPLSLPARQPGYNKRMRKLVPQIERTINYLAFSSPGFCDQLRLLDSTPVPCAASRETVRREPR